MVKVAIAGATTGLGKMVLSALLESCPHDIVVLSRNLNPTLTAQGADVRTVDYNDHDSITASLKGVHTVLSLIGGLNTNERRDAELALLAAAKEAGVKRFAPSEYALSNNENVDFYNGKKIVWDAVKKSGLEYTKFSNGVLMESLGTGTPKGELEALGGLRPWTFVINMKAGTADLPGDGNAKVVFTRTRDVGRFVAAALSLEHWEEEMGMVGETTTYNEVVAAIEKVTKRKLLVKQNTTTELDEMILENESSRFYNQIRRKLAVGEGVVPPILNQLFPNIKPWTIDQYLETWWSGVEFEEPAWA